MSSSVKAGLRIEELCHPFWGWVRLLTYCLHHHVAADADENVVDELWGKRPCSTTPGVRLSQSARTAGSATSPVKSAMIPPSGLAGMLRKTLRVSRFKVDALARRRAAQAVWEDEGAQRAWSNRR